MSGRGGDSRIVVRSVLLLKWKVELKVCKIINENKFKGVTETCFGNT